MTKELHVYASEAPHEEVWVVGNATGLLALKEAITRALHDGSAGADAHTNDGEGYKVLVVRAPGLVPFESINTPYNGEYVGHRNHPITMLGVERYKELMREEPEKEVEEVAAHEQCLDCDALSSYHRDETYHAHCGECAGDWVNGKCEDDK